MRGRTDKPSIFDTVEQATDVARANKNPIRKKVFKVVTTSGRVWFVAFVGPYEAAGVAALERGGYNCEHPADEVYRIIDATGTAREVTRTGAGDFNVRLAAGEVALNHDKYRVELLADYA